MKALTLLFLCASIISGGAQTVGHNTIKTYVLDDENVFVIHVPQPNQGVTTLSFPAGITALQGSNVS